MVLGVGKPATKKADFTSSSTHKDKFTHQQASKNSQNTPEFTETAQNSIPTVTDAQDIPQKLETNQQVQLKMRSGEKELDIVYQATSSAKQGNKRMKNIRSKLRSKRT